jgi:hypothetical protein
VAVVTERLTRFIVTISALTHAMDAMLKVLEDFSQVLYRAKMNIRETLHVGASLVVFCSRRLTLDAMAAELSYD